MNAFADFAVSVIAGAYLRWLDYANSHLNYIIKSSLLWILSYLFQREVIVSFIFSTSYNFVNPDGNQLFFLLHSLCTLHTLGYLFMSSLIRCYTEYSWSSLNSICFL